MHTSLCHPPIQAIERLSSLCFSVSLMISFFLQDHDDEYFVSRTDSMDAVVISSSIFMMRTIDTNVTKRNIFFKLIVVIVTIGCGGRHTLLNK